MKYIKFLNNFKYFLCFLLFGLAIFCYPMLISAFDLMPGDGLDIKLVGYIMEHSWLWLNRAVAHESFWSMPFYYPFENTLAFSDVSLGMMPVYCAFRLFLEPFCAFQALFVAICILNYAVFYYFLRVLKFRDLSSSFGAFIFAFSLMRYFRINHFNWFPQFFVILTLIFFFKVDLKNSKLKNSILFALAFLSLAAQFWTNYALGWGFCFFGILFVLILLCFKNPRSIIFCYFKNFWIYILSCFVLFLVCLAPLAVHYLDVGILRNEGEIFTYAQTIASWFRNLSILDSILFFQKIDYIDIMRSGEMSASVGIFTLFVSLFGLSKTKNFRIAFFILLFLILILSIKIGDFCLWQYIFKIIPGASGIRVIVRFSFVALIVFALGCCIFCNYFENLNAGIYWQKILCAAAILIVMLEHIPYKNDPHSGWETYSWSKKAFIEQIADAKNKIPENCRVVYFDAVFENVQNPNSPYMIDETSGTYIALQLLSMWAAGTKSSTGPIYTMNGTTGVAKNTAELRDKFSVCTIPFVFDMRTFDYHKYLLGK